MKPTSVARIDMRKADRAPLLLIAGSEDHTIPPRIPTATIRRYRRPPARTDLREFPNRGHLLQAQDGWEEIADYIETWVAEVVPPMPE